jgi:hypothetical protein
MAKMHAVEIANGQGAAAKQFRKVVQATDKHHGGWRNVVGGL